MLLEMHCHTAGHSPCSTVSALDLVRQVAAKGLQGIVITEHHYLWSQPELKKLRRQAGVPDHFLILSGQELRSAEFGDVLIFGAAETLPRGTSVVEVRRRFPEAAIVWAHPYRSSKSPSAEQLQDPNLDAIEIFNANHTVRGNSRGLQDWHRYRFTAIAGTDTHGKLYAGTYPTQFDHPVATVEELAREIRTGRCRPFLKEIPRSGANSQVTEVVIGTKGMDEERERIIIKTLHDPEKWQGAERTYRIMKAIYSHGFSAGQFRVPRPIDADAASMSLFEQGMRGKSLFDKLVASSADDGRALVALAARWLAKLHNCRLAVTPFDEFLVREERRLARYLDRFTEIGHPHLGKASEVAAKVAAEEQQLVRDGAETMIQGHGDFHPKNVYVGQDLQDDRSTLYIAAIDYDSSLVLPPAFDVGCFLAQFRNQLFSHDRVLRAIPEAVFLDAYAEAAVSIPQGFPQQVELFKARTNLSIVAYLIKLGLGDSEDVWRLLVEAEKALCNL